MRIHRNTPEKQTEFEKWMRENEPQLTKKRQKLALAVLEMHDAWAFIEHAHCLLLSILVARVDQMTSISFAASIYYAPTADEVRFAVVDGAFRNAAKTIFDQTMHPRVEAAWTKLRGAIRDKKRIRNTVAHSTSMAVKMGSGKVDVRLTSDLTHPRGDFSDESKDALVGYSENDIIESAKKVHALSTHLFLFHDLIAETLRKNTQASLEILQKLESELGLTTPTPASRTPEGAAFQPQSSGGSDAEEPPSR